MKDNLHNCIRLCFGDEGGFSHHPADKGGATRFGITQRTLQAWRKRKVTVDDVRKLTLAEAADILDHLYWRKVWGDELPAGIDYAMFDYAVNSGPAQAVKAAQRLVKVDRDGSMGPLTLRAIEEADRRDFILDYMKARLTFMKGLRTWKTFGKGWANRVNRVRLASLAMVTDAATAVVVADATLTDASPSDEFAKAPSNETSIESTSQGQATILTAFGSVTTGIGQAQTAVEPLVGKYGWLDWLFVVLTAVGLLALVLGVIWSFHAENKRIVTGNPV